MMSNIYAVNIDGNTEHETADQYFIWAKNNYIDDKDALKKIQQILFREDKLDKVEYVKFITEALDDEIGQIKRDYADGLKGSEERPFGDYMRCCAFDRGFISVIMESPEKYATHLIKWDDFKKMSQKDFDTVCNDIIFYNSHETELVEEDPMDLFVEEMT